MNSVVLLLVSLFGLLVPNALFLYWLFVEYQGVAAIMQDKLALGFMIDAFMVLGLLAFYFARNPIGRIRWPWFVVLSLLGGLGFSLPFYYWLNKRIRSSGTG